MVAQYPGNAIGLVLTLGHRRITRALGPADRLAALGDLQRIVGIGLALANFLDREFVRPHGIARGIFDARRIIGDSLDLQHVQAAEIRDLGEAEGGILDQPASSGMRHKRLGQGVRSGLKDHPKTIRATQSGWPLNQMIVMESGKKGK